MELTVILMYIVSFILFISGSLMWPTRYLLILGWALLLGWYTYDIVRTYNNAPGVKIRKSILLLFVINATLSMLSLYIVDYPRATINVVVSCMFISLLGLIYYCRKINFITPIGLYLYTLWVFGLLLVRPNL